MIILVWLAFISLVAVIIGHGLVQSLKFKTNFVLIVYLILYLMTLVLFYVVGSIYIESLYFGTELVNIPEVSAEIVVPLAGAMPADPLTKTNVEDYDYLAFLNSGESPDVGSDDSNVSESLDVSNVTQGLEDQNVSESLEDLNVTQGLDKGKGKEIDYGYHVHFTEETILREAEIEARDQLRKSKGITTMYELVKFRLKAKDLVNKNKAARARAQARKVD